jgi:hypothetical protein
MNRIWILVAAAGLIAGASGAARADFGPAAQSGSLQELFGGDSMPLSKKLKEMDGTWRRLTIGGSPAENKGSLGGLAGGLMGMLFGGGGGNTPSLSAPPSYYTRGATITVGPETFLIAYRHQTKGLDFGDLVAQAGQAGQGGQPKLPDPEKLTADTDLQLTLLNVRTIQLISGIRAFNLDRELAEAQKEFESELSLRKQMEGGPFGGGAGAAVAPDPVIDDEPAPKAPPKKPAPKKPAPKKPTTRRK